MKNINPIQHQTHRKQRDKNPKTQITVVVAVKPSKKRTPKRNLKQE
jgi:hypothetical protein